MATEIMDPIADPLPDPMPDPAPASEPLEPELVENEPAEQSLARVATTLVSRAKTFQIVDAAAFDVAGHMLETLKDQKRKIVEFFEADIERAHAAWKGLTTKRAGFVLPLDEAISVLSAGYGTFAKNAREAAERERRRLEQEAQDRERARLKEEADRLAAEAKAKEEAALMAPSRSDALALETEAAELMTTAAEVRQEAATVQAPVLPSRPVVTPPKGTSVKANWSHEVTDLMELVKAVAAGSVSVQAICANDTYLRQRAKADKDTVRIPGVRIYDAVTVSHRRR